MFRITEIVGTRRRGWVRGYTPLLNLLLRS